MIRKIRREPHPAEELFTGALREASLFDDLLRKVGGDRSVVVRLIEYERQERPSATRLTCLQNAISRWLGARKPKVAEADRVSAFDLWYCYDYGEAPKVACAILLSENDI